MEISHLDDIFITQRLRDRLSIIGSYPITTVIAPMGYGKTTAIKWWSTRRTKRNESSLFFKQIIMTDSVTDFWTGFCKMFRDFPNLYDQLTTLAYPRDVQSLSICSEILDAALSNYKEDIYFIIDDLHILPSKVITSIVLFFARNLPSNIHIVLLSRNQIFNEEEKMRLGNMLGEISAYDLRLNTKELYEYAERCDVKASARELDELATLSEGWISIVYLNFKSYEKNRKWLSSTTDIFSLINEVLLEPLSEKEREFLILIGISNEFTKEKAAYLWAGSGIGGDSEILLDSLSKNNAFITRTDNLYRYHHMLQQCARYYFSQKPQEYRQKSYTRLGDWHMEQEDYVPAYFSYAKAENFDKILSCIEKDRAKSLNAEHAKDFFSWVGNCPEEILLQHPSALTVCMLKMFAFNNIAELKRLKSLLLKSLEMNKTLSDEEKNNLLGDAEISESFTAYNNISAMSAYHRRACALLGRTTYSVDQKGAWTFSSPSILMMYHRAVGFADTENEEMQECMPYYYQVSDFHGNGSEHCFEAELHYVRGEFIDADISNKMAMSAAKRKNQFSIMLTSEFLNMRLELLRGDYDKIRKSMQTFRELLREEKQYTLLNTLDICQMFISSMLNRPQDTPKWLAEGRLSETLMMFPAMPMLHTFYNQLLLAKSEYTALVARREECQKLYGIFNNVLCIIWLHIQLAAALEKLGRAKDALDELTIALDLAIPDNILMPFAENNAYISKQLSVLKEKKEYAEYIDRIFELSEMVLAGKQKIRREHFEKHIDFGLSERELEIAKLAAQRMTSAEIADKLHISAGTVQNHLTRIFDKIGISGTKKNKRLELEKLFNVQKMHNY
ncbi:MAG: LuxR C-terminal-related transcriptional regulator [Saccharofermentanales bacterium]